MNTNAAAPVAETSTALAVSPPATALARPVSFEPQNFAQLEKLCGILAATGMGGLKSPGDALARIMAGAELGLSAIQSIRAIRMIGDQQNMDASVMQALCMRHPSCEEFHVVESTDRRATLHVKRAGRPRQIITYTIEDAERAKLTKPGGAWEKNPKQMLRARCKSEAARLEFPDLMYGIGAVEDYADNGIAVVEVVTPAISQVEDASDRYEALSRSLVAQVAAASTDDEKKSVRVAIKAAKDSGDLVNPWLADVIAAYETKFPAKRSGAPATAPQTTTAQETPRPASDASPPAAESAAQRQPGDD